MNIGNYENMPTILNKRELYTIFVEYNVYDFSELKHFIQTLGNKKQYNTQAVFSWLGC